MQTTLRRWWPLLLLAACGALWESRATLFEIHDAAAYRAASLDAAH